MSGHEAKLTIPVSDRDHIRGTASALITLVEYGDYECPYCGQAYPVVEQLIERFGDDLRFAFRHFPLTQMHPHAEHAAEAAEAAGSQGFYWDMHDALYTHQDALDDIDLVRYAAAAGADSDLIVAALEERTFESRVREDFLNGVRSGVNGTPTFFIEGVRYDGPHDVASLAAAIEEVADEMRSQG